jgi:hypothetical protein
LYANFRDFVNAFVNELFAPYFQGFSTCCRKRKNAPVIFPQKNPQAVDKPVDNLGRYVYLI